MHPISSALLRGCAWLGAVGAVFAQAPQLSVRHELSGDALVGAATGDQQAVEIAHGSTASLTVWSDRRAKLFTNAGASESSLDIWMQRLAPDGTPLDPTPTCLGFLPGDDVAPRVTWGGASWLVTWSSQAPGASIYTASIVGVRVAADGAVLDAAPFTIMTYPNAAIVAHSVASDGQRWVVISGESTSGLPDVSAVRVSANGSVLDPAPASLFPSQWVTGIDIAAAQGVFLVTWSQYFTNTSDDVQGRRYDANLQPLDAAPFKIASSTWPESGAHCASNGSSFFVSWMRSLNSTYQGDVQAARVTSTGTVLDATPIALTGNRPFIAGSTHAAWDGSKWYVAWTYSGIELGRVAQDGSVLDVDAFDFRPGQPATQSNPRIAGSALGGVQMVWTDNRAGSYEGLDVYGSHVVDAAQQGVDTIISRGAPAQLGADLAHGSVNNALVYRSESSGGRRIVVTRLDAAGLPLDAEPIEVTNDFQATSPAIAWDGNVYLIVWSGATSNVQFRRMDANGTLLDAAPIVVGVGTSPDVAGRNGDFLVTYTRAVAYPLQQFPVIALVHGSDGSLVSGPTMLNSNYAVQVAACSTPNGFVVAWQRNYWNNDPHSDVACALVDAAGVASAPIFIAGTFNAYNGDISVASSGNEVLFVWRFGTASNLTRRLDARRMSLAGTFLDAGPFRVVSGLVAEQSNPEVAWDGAQYVCVFQDLRNTTSMLDQRSDVYGARILASGVVRDPQGFLIEATSMSESAPVVVGLGATRALMASTIMRPESPLAAFRIATRTFEGDAVPPSTYCTAKVNSLGFSPAIGFSGSPSVSASNLFVTLARGIAGAPAMAILSSTQASIPAFNATLCIGPAIQRGPIVFLNGAGSGNVAVPLAATDLGAQRCYQWWSRDVLHPDGTGVSLSNGLVFTVSP